MPKNIYENYINGLEQDIHDLSYNIIDLKFEAKYEPFSHLLTKLFI